MDEDTPIPPPHPDRGPGHPPHWKTRSTWLRLLFMVLFYIIYELARIVVAATVVLNFLVALFTSHPNERLTRFGQGLATYLYQIIRFLTYNTEERPFPFDRDWPQGPPEPPL